MLRLTLLIAGTALLIVGGLLLLLLLRLAVIGINDGEWGRIARTGSPSAPEKFRWSAWQPNDGSMYPHPSYQPERRPASLPEFRVGHGKGLLFDFTAYQGRFPHDGAMHEFPAIGPGWGARYHWHWAILAFGFGIAALIGEALLRRAKAKLKLREQAA